MVTMLIVQNIIVEILTKILLDHPSINEFKDININMQFFFQSHSLYNNEKCVFYLSNPFQLLQLKYPWLSNQKNNVYCEMDIYLPRQASIILQAKLDTLSLHCDHLKSRFVN